MKKTILTLLALTSIGAHAELEGIPSEDPIVASMREKYSNAIVPSASDLRMGSTWTCKEFYAYKESFYVSDRIEAFNFSQFDGIFINGALGSNAQNFVITPFGLTANHSKEPLTMIDIRVDTISGHLIGEVSVTPERAASFEATTVSSVGRSNMRAFSYFVCPENRL